MMIFSNCGQYRWLDYVPVGKLIEGAPIMACKVPLSQVHTWLTLLLIVCLYTFIVLGISPIIFIVLSTNSLLGYSVLLLRLDGNFEVIYLPGTVKYEYLCIYAGHRTPISSKLYVSATKVRIF